MGKFRDNEEERLHQSTYSGECSDTSAPASRACQLKIWKPRRAGDTQAMFERTFPGLGIPSTIESRSASIGADESAMSI